MADQQDESRRTIRTKNQDRDYHSDENEEPRRSRMVGECQQAVDGEQQEAAGCWKPPLVRSKTFDNSLLTQIPTDANGKIERKKSHYSQLSKSNCQYHKIFKEISKEEQLRQSYTCALQKDILYQGRMFVSDHWICFHSKVFGKDTKIAIPVTSVTNIKKTKTAILVPNALVISTTNDRYVFVSFLSRENTYKFLMSVCLHLEEKSPCNSPVPSSAGPGLRSQRSPCSPRSPRFPLNFPADFGDLDAAVRQRRHELEESSSSDSQTPDDDKMAGFRVPPFLDVLKRTENAAPPDRQDLQHRVKSQQQKQQNQNNKLRDGGSERIVDKRSRIPVSLNTLLYVYLFLVCVLVLSSCFLAFKIISLEHRLTSLSSISGFPSHQDGLQRENSAMTSDLFSELLTVNLLKLEKVQKNLQRLLDEAA